MEAELVIFPSLAVLFVSFLLYMALKRKPCRYTKCNGRITKMRLMGIDGRFYKVMRCNKCYR